MKTIVLILLSTVILSSCAKNESCEEGPVTPHFLDCNNPKYELNIDISNNYTIIRSQSTYDAEVTGTCHPSVDFSEFDLVIGKQSSGNVNDTIKYDLRRICPDNELILTVDIIQSDATRPDNVVYHALIPKLSNSESISVIVNVQ